MLVPLKSLYTFFRNSFFPVTKCEQIKIELVNIPDIMKVLDCPNGFVYLNNRCFKVLDDNTYDKHLAICDDMLGELMSVGSSGDVNVLVAKALLTMFSKTKAFLGVKSMSNGTWVNITGNARYGQ